MQFPFRFHESASLYQFFIKAIKTICFLFILFHFECHRFCMTDMYDEWEDDPDDYLNYRHQRRLSDPSANLNNYSRYGWKTKPTPSNEHSSKALSQNEGLDSLANEVSEIEAGDLRDGTYNNKQCFYSFCIHKRCAFYLFKKRKQHTQSVELSAFFLFH